MSASACCSYYTPYTYRECMCAACACTHSLVSFPTHHGKISTELSGRVELVDPYLFTPYKKYIMAAAAAAAGSGAQRERDKMNVSPDMTCGLCVRITYPSSTRISQWAEHVPARLFLCNIYLLPAECVAAWVRYKLCIMHLMLLRA